MENEHEKSGKRRRYNREEQALAIRLLEDGSGRRRRSWVLRMVLSYSRKGYSEAVMRQDTESFLRCLENALRSFGGVPAVLNLDNLKAGVIKADWYDPEINPKLADFCRHYGVSVMPCRPATPQHKGKVERGVGYVCNNALKGRRFESLGAENGHLAHWEAHVADTRIHGTTCKQVAALFEEEKAHLQPLSGSLFPCCQEARRTVGRDSFVGVAKAFYEAPPEYIGSQVWVRWDSRVARVINQRGEQVQMHQRLEPGKFSRTLGCGGMSRPVLESRRYRVERAGMIGGGYLRWELVGGNWFQLFSHLDRPEVMPAAAAGATDELLDVSMREGDGPFGVRYQGYIDVPADGVWTFHAPEEYVGASCEPGYDLRVWIDGEEWDLGQRHHGRGLWSVPLAKGPHQLLVTFADARNRDGVVHKANLAFGYPSPWVVWKGESPVIEISGPGVDKQPIPAAWLRQQAPGTLQ